VAEVRYLPGAYDDFLEALGWYRQRSSRAAAGFQAALEVAFGRIADSPLTYALCDERHRFYILKRYPFSVVYRVETELILVVAIAHSSRAAHYWQGRD
jgi:plasmid stabilization system protein ParE